MLTGKNSTFFIFGASTMGVRSQTFLIFYLFQNRSNFDINHHYTFLFHLLILAYPLIRTWSANPSILSQFCFYFRRIAIPWFLFVLTKLSKEMSCFLLYLGKIIVHAVEHLMFHTFITIYKQLCSYSMLV